MIDWLGASERMSGGCGCVPVAAALLSLTREAAKVVGWLAGLEHMSLGSKRRHGQMRGDRVWREAEVWFYKSIQASWLKVGCVPARLCLCLCYGVVGPLFFQLKGRWATGSVGMFDRCMDR